MLVKVLSLLSMAIAVSAICACNKYNPHGYTNVHNPPGPVHNPPGMMHNQHGQMYNQHEQMQNQHEPIRNQHEVVHNQHGPIHNQQGPIHNQHGPIHNQHGPIHNQLEPMHNQHGPIHNQHEPMHNRHGQMHNQHGPTYNKHGPIHNQHGPIHNQHRHSRPSPNPYINTRLEWLVKGHKPVYEHQEEGPAPMFQPYNFYRHSGYENYDSRYGHNRYYAPIAPTPVPIETSTLLVPEMMPSHDIRY